MTIENIIADHLHAGKSFSYDVYAYQAAIRDSVSLPEISTYHAAIKSLPKKHWETQFCLFTPLNQITDFFVIFLPSWNFNGMAMRYYNDVYMSCNIQQIWQHIPFIFPRLKTTVATCVLCISG